MRLMLLNEWRTLRMRLISGSVLLFFLIAANASNTRNAIEPHSTLHDEQNDRAVPVTYGKKDDGFPDSVTLRGQIAKVRFTGDCGVSRGAGVLQIKLARPAPGYDREHIYVVAPCLLGYEGDEQYRGKEVCMTVKKMKPGDTCSADYIQNTIDSKGVPFYCLSWKSSKYKEFLKQVECNTR
jgi:hypothetical protein